MDTPARPAVELVCTGSELLSGRTINSHAATLAALLTDLGLPLVRETTIPDERAAIRDAIVSALGRAPIVITTGGLGPTSDDLTRDVAAEIAGARVVMHEPTKERIRLRYESAGRVFTALAARHALIVENAEVLENRVGLCPGELVRIGDRYLFLLPGPPAEFRAVLEDGVLPRLRELAGPPPAMRVLMTCCIGESDILRLLPESEFPGPEVEVAYCARPGRVEIRLFADSSRRAAVERAAARARAALAEWIYAEKPCELEEAVIDQLKGRGRTLAVAESCTGGLIGHRLTNVPGSSAVFRGGVTAYANAAKEQLLGVPSDALASEGAVSETVARAMAEGARARFGADLAVGVTGIAGPTGGTPEKPVGTVWIATAGPRETTAHRFRFHGGRTIVKELAATYALDQIRRYLAQL